MVVSALMKNSSSWAVSLRVAVLVVLSIAAIAVVLAHEPIPQNPAYHLFADRRAWLGIANFSDIASNLAFAAIGAIGLWFVLRPKAGETFEQPTDRWPYLIFFVGVALVSVGSAYYHAAPDNGRLIWDRLPMTVAFMALFSAFVADRVDRRIGVKWLLPILLAAGFLSVTYWAWTESMGRGDLRFYYLVQFFPMIALPLICWLFPQARYTGGGYLFWMIAWYAAAKSLELFDQQVFDLLANTVSGHTLKHLASAVVVFVVIRMLAAFKNVGWKRVQQPNPSALNS